MFRVNQALPGLKDLPALRESKVRVEASGSSVLVRRGRFKVRCLVTCTLTRIPVPRTSSARAVELNGMERGR